MVGSEYDKYSNHLYFIPLKIHVTKFFTKKTPTHDRCYSMYFPAKLECDDVQ